MSTARVIPIETPQEAARRFAASALREGFVLESLHVYRHADGTVDFYRARAKHPDGRKWIRPMYWNGSEFVLGEPEFPNGLKPLYHLPDLAKRPADPVFVVEGETCVNALVKLGLLATTSGASNSADKADWRPITGRSVTIWPDNDEAGTRYADEVDAQILPLGCTVRRISVEALELPDKGDAVDWLKEHPTATAADVMGLKCCDEEPATVDTVNAWPAPLPLVADIRPEPYPVDALPDAIRAAVLEVQAFVQAPIPLVAASALSAVSCAVQGLVDVARTATLKGPASLYMLTIAESGERKSTCDYYFSRAIRAFEANQAEIAAPEVARCRARLEAWESEKAGVNSAISKEAKAGEVSGDLKRRLEDLERNEPQAHRYPRMIRGDSTQEHLAHALASEWPSAGIISAEGGSIFGSHAMGRESVMRYMATLNGLWSAEVLRVGRRSSESFTVDGARLTVGLQVQPEVIGAFNEANGDLARGMGLLARFLISAPESTQGSRPFVDEPAQWVALDRFGRRVDELLGAVQVDDAGALRLTTIALGVAAKAAWVDLHNAIEAEVLKGGELATVRDVASKAADNVARLAALFHVFEKGPTGTIEAPAVEAAGRIVTWHLLESKRFFGEKFLSPEQKDAVDLESWLIARCREQGTNRIQAREILQYVTPTRLRIAAARDEAIEVLVALGRVRWVEDGRQRFVEVNPALLEDGGDA